MMTPQNKPKYFKITANVMVNGNLERRYSRFDFDPQKLRTLNHALLPLWPPPLNLKKANRKRWTRRQ